jgi:tellurium resistance protein TerZ
MTYLPLSKGRYSLGLAWDRGTHSIDVDLQAVIVNAKGCIIDAVYYNKLTALNAITHSGDEQTGEKVGFDEMVLVNLENLAMSTDQEKQVKLIIFVVAAYCGGSLQDAPNLSMRVLQGRKGKGVASFSLARASGAAKVVGVMERTDRGGWFLESVDTPSASADGRHFVDILEPALGSLIRDRIPSAPARQKVAFAMEKGDVFDFPETAKMGKVFAGVGWDAVPGVTVDVDVSAICFSQDGRELGAVFFGNAREFGLEHSGDNDTGEGDGDDEVISAELDGIPAEVGEIFFVANVFGGATFDQLSNPYCRLLDGSGAELVRYRLGEGRGEKGLIVSRLFREPGSRWGFQALGQFCRGSVWKDAVPEVAALVGKPATAFQASPGAFPMGPPAQCELCAVM